VNRKIPVCDFPECQQNGAEEFSIGGPGRPTEKHLLCAKHARPIRVMLEKLPKQKKPSRRRGELKVVRSEDIPKK
jgi:hypothetical protein